MNCWLIERTDSNLCRCLGKCNGHFKFITPMLAIRFPRKEEADAVIRIHKLDNVIAVEHSFDDRLCEYAGNGMHSQGVPM